MKVFVTGGSGFIGRHLARRLRQDGHEVVTLDRRPGADIVIDLTLFGNDNVLRGVDVLFHLAANSDIQAGDDDLSVDFYDGVMATHRLYRSAVWAGVKRVVFASSSAVYGENTNFPVSESEELCPISHYGAAKVYGEMLGGALHGIDVVNLRLGNVVGGDVTHGLLYSLRQQSKAHPEYLELMGNGKQFKDWVYVDDVVSAFAIAASLIPGSGGTYNIGSGDGMIKGEDFTITSIATMFRRKFCPGAEIRTLGGKRGWNGDVTEMLLDSSRAARYLGWESCRSQQSAIQKAIGEMP